MNQNQLYQQSPQRPPAPRPVTPVKKQSSGVSVAALVCGCVAFLFNPLYFVSLAAIITGIVGIASAKGQPKGMAVAGLVLGLVSWGVQFTVDLILSVFTFGLSFFI